MSMKIMENPNVVVIDNGSGGMKAGFAGEDAPRAIFPTIVAHHRHRSSSSRTDPIHSYIGRDAQIKRDALTIQHPIEHGIVTNWDAMEKIWHYTFDSELRVASKDHAVLVTEAPLNPKGNRERMTQILFEHLRVPALYVTLSAVLSSYSCGRRVGIVVDSGDGVTCTVPICDGYPVRHAVNRLDVAGRDLTNSMTRLLAERGYAFSTTVEREIVRDLKEKCAYVALDFDEELAAARHSSSVKKTYKLPDGEMISVGDECFRCVEALFKPHMVGVEGLGVAELLHDSVRKCTPDLQRDLYRRIVVSGGTTLCSNFCNRLQREIQALVPPSMITRLIADSDRQHAAWIGGSILGSLSTFEKIWISKKEYDESGPSIVHRKCL